MMDNPAPENKTHSVPLQGHPSPDCVLESEVVAGFVAARSARSDAWLPPSAAELQRSFPQYEIRGMLGHGGMGAVYKGWQRSLDRIVAIKILPASVADDGMNYAERFKQEARAMAKFRHPGIVAVYDAGETLNGLLYFVMEYVEGTDVAQLITEYGRLPVAQALRIARRVCEALSYAHSQGVVHRDIKPSNVMIEADGSVKVADFGLAKLAGSEASQHTTSNVAIGTPDFMPPEALDGKGHVDHRADLYAVGGTLYQMLTGRAPHGRFDPPSTFVPRLDPRFDRIVDKAMQSDPERRYASAAEMGADLAALPCVEADMEGTTQTSAEGASRRIWMKPVLAGLLVVVLSGMAVSGLSRWKEKRRRAHEESVAEHAAADEIRRSWRPVPTKLNAVIEQGAVHLQHYETWGAPRFRMANVSVRAGVVWQADPPGRNELIKVTARWTDAEHYYACLYGATVEVGYYRAPGMTALQRWPIEPPPQAGEEITLQLACVGHRIGVWVRERFVGVIEDRTLSEAANVGVQAVDGHIRSLDYLDLDDLPEAAAFQRLGLDPGGSFVIGAGGNPPEVASKAEPFVNTLGMKLVPVPVTGGPTSGKRVLFSIWETRVQDYEVFAKETQRAWPKPKFAQGPAHPVVKVNCDDAQAFCAWLTQRERKSGRIGAQYRYRLPTDREWSCAAGIGDREDPAAEPAKISGRLADVFPWGTAWPPPPGAGNYSGEEATGHETGPEQKILTGCRDGFAETAPAGSFAANALGIFDLGGNAWEWCSDRWKEGDPARVVRGGSFASAGRTGLLSSYRDNSPPEARTSSFGFRVVLDGTDTPGGKPDTAAATASRWRDAFAESPLKQIIANAEHTPRGYRLPSGNHWQVSPQSLRSGAVRFRATEEGEKFASLYIIHDDLQSERVRFLNRNNEWTLSKGTNGRDETDLVAKRAASPSDGQPHALLFARVGGRLLATLDGRLIFDEADPSEVPGKFMLDIYSDAAVCVETVEHLDLDGIAESEALTMLGIEKK